VLGRALIAVALLMFVTWLVGKLLRDRGPRRR
jgi:hypothetical protein